MSEINMVTTEELKQINVETASQSEQVNATETTEDTSNEAAEDGDVSPEKSQQEIEKEEEAKLRSKYPGVKGPGSSAFLQKRLSKGTKYFDSGDYNMAKAKTLPSGVADPAFKQPLQPTGAGNVVTASSVSLRLPGGGPCPTGSTIPTPDCVAHRRLSHLQSKLATNL